MAGGTPGGSRSRFFADVLSFGWLLPSAIAVGAGLGWLLDRWLSTSPVLTIAVGLLGFAAGARQLFKESTTLAGEAPSEPEEKADNRPPDERGP